MSAFVERLLAAVESGGGLALGLALLAENLFPPIPSELILPLAGFAVQDGRVPHLEALGAATAGSTVGAAILYAVGRFGGRSVLYRYHWLFRLEPEQLDRADAWFDRHGSWVVLWGRMVPIFRSVVSIPAGFSEMPLLRFMTLTAIGSLLWNSLLIGAGIALGERWELVERYTSAYKLAIVAAVALVGVFVFVRILRARRAGSGSPPAGGDGGERR